VYENRVEREAETVLSSFPGDRQVARVHLEEVAGGEREVDAARAVDGDVDRRQRVVPGVKLPNTRVALTWYGLI
jgi:hypothetical protein